MAQAPTTRSDWLAANPPASDRLSQTLATVARRTLTGEDFQHAVPEFLDEFTLRADERSRSEAIVERPLATGDPRHDAYLGALAEHLAAVHDLERPAWSVEPDRFLPSFLAHRVGEDGADLRLLASELGLRKAEEVLAVAERTYGDRLDPAARFFTE